MPANTNKPKTIAAAERRERSREATNNNKRLREIDRQISGVKERAKSAITGIKRVATKETRGLLAERRDLQRRNQTLGERLAA